MCEYTISQKSNFHRVTKISSELQVKPNFNENKFYGTTQHMTSTGERGRKEEHLIWSECVTCMPSIRCSIYSTHPHPTPMSPASPSICRSCAGIKAAHSSTLVHKYLHSKTHSPQASSPRLPPICGLHKGSRYLKSVLVYVLVSSLLSAVVRSRSLDIIGCTCDCVYSSTLY